MTKNTRRPHGDARPTHEPDRGPLGTADRTLPPEPDGQRNRRKVTGRTEAECRTKANQLRVQLGITGQLDSTTATVGDVLDGYVAHVVARKKPQTQGTYKRWIRLYVRPHLGRRKLARLQPRDVTAWMTMLMDCGGDNGTPLTIATVRAARNQLSAAMRWAKNEGLISNNVVRDAYTPSVDESGEDTDDPEVEYLEAGQVRDLFTACEGWDHYAGRWST